jgi:hypothetical protein
MRHRSDSGPHHRFSVWIEDSIPLTVSVCFFHRVCNPHVIRPLLDAPPRAPQQWTRE